MATRDGCVDFMFLPPPPLRSIAESATETVEFINEKNNATAFNEVNFDLRNLRQDKFVVWRFSYSYSFRRVSEIDKA